MQKRLVKDEQTADSEALLQGVKMINERADSLSEFIASYSRLYHLPQPVKARFNLSDLVDNLRLLYPKVTIENPSTDDYQTHADKNQLEQVLINLFKNAAEAMLNCQHPVIQVSSHWVGDWQHITVRDQGTGIANLDNVFVPFYTTKPSGSGIGLTLCQHILFNHKGTIKIDNHSSGQGVEVVLSLPRA